jgi:ribonuclease-3
MEADLYKDLEARLEALQEALDYRFKDGELLRRAITHASYANENGSARDNQRLEFLGDSVLGLVISTRLFDQFAAFPEGRLSRLRSRLVCEGTLAQQARRLGLGGCLRLGRGERTSGGQDKDSLLSDAYEAVLAAIYLDGGYPAAQQVILRAFEEEIAKAASRQTSKDHKTRLQELIQANSDERPRYAIVETSGPPHARLFTAEARVGDRVLGRGTGSNKKAAQQDAARLALETLEAQDQP